MAASATEIPTQEILSDEEVLARIQAEMASRMASRPRAERPRATSVQTLYEQAIALVASATGKKYAGGTPRLSEQTATKTLELCLMWALNARAQGIPTSEFLDTGEGYEEDDGTPVAPPEPQELIAASEDQSDTQETK